MEEIWKDIKGYENEYQVSNIGRIRSLDRYKYQNGRYGQIQRLYRGKILKFDQDKDGYFTVKLRHKVFHRVHRLVAQTFLENPENKNTVNHKDGNKKNNCINNLEWATEKENTQHAHKTGLAKSAMIGKKGKLSNNFRIRVQIDEKTGEIIGKYNGAAEAERITGIKAQNISDCCNQKRKTAGGYIWRYKD